MTDGVLDAVLWLLGHQLACGLLLGLVTRLATARAARAQGGRA